ncbi:MAG: hypothetical protein ACFFAN_08020, partial [Promethearchaeota archaeon]
LYLKDQNKKAVSIRKVSENTGLSMRVVKNILLQLEKFNQIERVIEKNNILPKWRITKFGTRVIKEAKGMDTTIKFPSREDELIYKVVIPKDFEKLKESNKQKQEIITSELNTLQIELSKILGPVLNLNDPIFEDLISFIIKRVKFLTNRVSNLSVDPIASYMLKKIGEKQKKVPKEEMNFILVEISFFNSIILNELKRISEFSNNLSHFIETGAISKAYSLGKDLREEIRTLTNLIYQRESITVNSHKISRENLKELMKNNINSNILDDIVEIPLNDEMSSKEIENIVLKFVSQLNKGEKQLVNHNYEITKNLPLFALYQLILDEMPSLDFTIEQLERVINSLADKGYIPGIKIVEENEDTYLKVVQLSAHDISEDESKLISIALKFEKFTLADIMEATKWTKERTYEILSNLTDLGIFKHSKSFLHGDHWYLVSERNV